MESVCSLRRVPLRLSELCGGQLERVDSTPINTNCLDNMKLVFCTDTKFAIRVILTQPVTVRRIAFPLLGAFSSWFCCRCPYVECSFQNFPWLQNHREIPYKTIYSKCMHETIYLRKLK